jgi:hypothetical protein
LKPFRNLLQPPGASDAPPNVLELARNAPNQTQSATTLRANPYNYMCIFGHGAKLHALSCNFANERAPTCNHVGMKANRESQATLQHDFLFCTGARRTHPSYLHLRMGMRMRCKSILIQTLRLSFNMEGYFVRGCVDTLGVDVHMRQRTSNNGAEECLAAL